MKSTNGRVSTTETNFSASELHDIIKQCGESGVSSFSYAGLSIEFGVTGSSEDESILEDTKAGELAPALRPEQEIPKKEIDEDAYERFVEEVRLSDPVYYEHLLEKEALDEAERKNA